MRSKATATDLFEAAAKKAAKDEDTFIVFHKDNKNKQVYVEMHGSTGELLAATEAVIMTIQDQIDSRIAKAKVDALDIITKSIADYKNDKAEE